LYLKKKWKRTEGRQNTDKRTLQVIKISEKNEKFVIDTKLKIN